MEVKKFGAVILAAGYSSRMNAFKPLLDIGGKSAVQGLIDELHDADITSVTVVTGHNRKQLASILHNSNVTEAYNDEFDKGMFSSIQKGLETARAKFAQCSGFFIIPVDCPLITSEMIKLLMQKVRETNSDDEFFVLTFNGKKGHPLYVPEMYINEIISYDGPGGLKGITDKYWDKMIRIACDDEGCVLDMDTQEGYQEILEFLEAGRKRLDLVTLASGRRIVLVRHGETQQHAEKMFIGQYDVPLNDKGRMQAQDVGKALAEEGINPEHIYTSPLCRAEESAKIIAGELNIKELTGIGDFREINLGAWDGMTVREVREKYPQQYAQRGKDIFAFKMGNKAENFYDVQYRAVNALRKLLFEDDSKDVVIVSHSAVIRALQNNLEGRSIDSNWNNLNKGEYIILEY